MYLAIGEAFSVRTQGIIGIFDLDNTTYSRHTRDFLTKAEKQGAVVTATEDIPRSFLLTHEFSMNRVYLTQFQSATLEKRIKAGEKSSRKEIPGKKTENFK